MGFEIDILSEALEEMKEGNWLEKYMTKTIISGITMYVGKHYIYREHKV